MTCFDCGSHVEDGEQWEHPFGIPCVQCSVCGEQDQRDEWILEEWFRQRGDSLEQWRKDIRELNRKEVNFH